jgi:hypothetical protein
MNPLINEDKIWEKIKNENIAIDHDIWELINHYMRNALGMISSGWQEIGFNPAWVVRAQSLVMTVLSKMALSQGASPEELNAMVQIMQEIAKGRDKLDSNKIIKMCDEAIDWDNDKLAMDMRKYCDRGIQWTKDADNFLKKLHAATDKGEQNK